jgi:hypothetical protein
MTHRGWNNLAFLFVALLGLAAGVRAADSTRAPNDIQTEALILRALRKDAQLGRLNLGVHVAGGTAKLCGPVPTAELKQRAISIVQHIEGVLTVSARDLYVSTSDQGRKRLTVLIQEERPTQTRAASVPAPPPQVEADRPPPKAAPPVRSGEATRLTANPRLASPAVSLAAAVEHLRQSSVRYQRIRARVQDATVYVHPGDSAVEDAMRFAQAIRRLPGVQHVVLSSGSR